MAIRKIETKEAKERKEKRNQVIIGVIMVALLLFSTAGYFVSELLSNKDSNDIDSPFIDFGGLRYYSDGSGILTLDLGGRAFYFYNLPNESRGVYQNTSGFDQYVEKPLYIVNENPAVQTLLTNLNGFYSRYQLACYEEECGNDLPIKNCEDNLIVFLEGEENRVEKIDNCLFLYGNGEIAADAISYNLLGIK